MLLTLLREIEDQTTNHAEIRSLIIEAAVAVLRHEKHRE